MKTSLSTEEQAGMKKVVTSGQALLRSGKAGKGKGKKVKEVSNNAATSPFVWLAEWCAVVRTSVCRLDV